MLLEDKIAHTHQVLINMSPLRQLSLAQVLQNYSPAHLGQLLRVNGFPYVVDLDKTELIALLTKQLYYKFDYFLRHLLLQDLLLLLLAGNHHYRPLPATSKEALQFFLDNGFLHLLPQPKGKLVLILPQELLAQLVVLLESEVLLTIRRREILYTTLTGLVALYGVFPLQQLHLVLARCFPRLFSTPPPAPVLQNALERVQADQYDLVKIGNYFLNNELAFNSRYREVLQSSADLAYYLPKTKEEIMNFALGEGNTESLAYQKLAAFLGKYWSLEEDEFETVLHNIVWSCASGIPPAELLEVFARQKCGLTGVSQLQNCRKLLEALAQNTRQWFLRGHTPLEVAATQNTLVIQFPGTTLHPK
ncbi:MAG: hypothetical protein RR321_08175 [Acidaminococcaceae bacterium]